MLRSVVQVSYYLVIPCLFHAVFKQNNLIIEKLNVEHYHLKSYCSCLTGRATIATFKCFNYTMNLKYLADCKLSVNARGIADNIETDFALPEINQIAVFSEFRQLAH